MLADTIVSMAVLKRDKVGRTPETETVHLQS